MLMAPLVQANGAAIPAIGLGTWSMTGEECRRAVAAALGCGYRHIDTASMYANEAEVGDGIRASGVPRGDICVTTKVWWQDIGADKLQRSAEDSLRKLGLVAVDLLLIHWPNPAIPVAQSIAALCDVKRKGLARHIGISNFPTKLMDQALAATSEPLVCNQVEYHPHLDQSRVLAACRKQGLALVSYCPLGRGAVGGVLEEPIVKDIARAKGRTAGQIVLRWHMEQPGVVAVPKSAAPARIAENLNVFDFTLTAAEMQRLSSLKRDNGRMVNGVFAPRWD
jgi:diketogulonate reductase-like aldo/keto reductase